MTALCSAPRGECGDERRAQAGARHAAGGRHAGAVPRSRRFARRRQSRRVMPAGALVLPDGSRGHRQDLLPARRVRRRCFSTRSRPSAGIDREARPHLRRRSSPPSASSRSEKPRAPQPAPALRRGAYRARASPALTNPHRRSSRRSSSARLRGCDAHFSVIISEEDIKLYKRLGIHVTCEPRYESQKAVP